MKKMKFSRSRFIPKGRVAMAMASCLTFSATSAIAAPDDTFRPYVTGTYKHYDNLFLIPNDQPNLPGMDAARSDSSQQIEAGILYNQKFGLQNVVAEAKLNKNYFNHFNQLDYTGHDLLALWNWKIASLLDGKLGATDTKTLAPYVDFHSQVKNLYVIQRQFASADWHISPHWRVHSGASRTQISYDAPAQVFNDYTKKSGELGLDYLFLKEGSVGFQFHHTVGSFPNQVLLSNNGYSENGYSAKLDWHVTAKSQLIFLGGWVKRSTDLAPDNNVTGFNGRFDFNWLPTGKTELDFALWRQFEPSLTDVAGFSLNTGTSAQATWHATGKIDVITKLSYEKRDFSSFIGGAQAFSYVDRTNQASLQVKYEPRQFLELVAGVSHALRSATIPLGGYVGNEASVSASMKF